MLMGPGAGPMRCWLSDDETAEQACTDHCELQASNVHTGKARTLARSGANWLQAGHGVWAARVQGAGYFDSLGRTRPNLIPLATDVTSGAVLVGDYDSGSGLWVWWPDGTMQPVYAGLLDIQQGCYRGGVAVFRASGLVHRWPQGDSRPALSDPRYAGGFLCGNGDYGFGWWPWDDMSRGLLLSSDGHDFNPDICILEDGHVRVVSSYTAGEGPGDLRIYDIDPVNLTVNGMPGVTYGAPSPVVPPVAQSARPIAVGCYDEPTYPDLTGPGWPLTSQTVGDMVTLNHDSVERIAAEDARAYAAGLPLYCYMDRSAFSPYEMPPQRQARQLAMPRYAVSPGHIPEMVAQLRSVIEGLQSAGYDCCLNIQLTRGLKLDGSYAYTEQDVIDSAVAAWRVAVETGALAVWCFAWARRDGIVAFPSFQEFVSKIRAATPDWQRFPVAPVTPIEKDVFMASPAFTLRKSHFKSGSWNPDARLYPDITNPANNLSVVDMTGEFRPGGLPNNGPSESFYVEGNKARVVFDSHEWTFLVDESR